MDQMIKIIDHLKQGKYKFETLFRASLAKRLLEYGEGCLASEKLFISKLKEQFTSNFTSNIDCMI
jgi:hypothetical protein